MNFMEEQKKYNEAVNEFNKNLIENSYARSYFNDLLRNSLDSYLKNQENPEKFNIETTSYINGVSANIPEEDKEKTLKPVLDFNQSLRQQAVENFNNSALESADKSSQMSRIEAENMALQGFRNGLPNKEQSVLDANYFDTIAQDNRAGILNDKDAVNLVETHENARITYALVNVLSDFTVPSSEKAELINRVERGETGNEYVDKLPATRRLEILKNTTAQLKQIDEYKQHLDKQQKTIEKDSWEQRQLNLLNYVRNNGDPRDAEKMITYQKATAPTLDDFNRVDNVYAELEGKTNPKIKQELENAFNSGLLERQEKLDLLYDAQDQLSVTDYQTLYNNIKNPVELEMKAQDVKIAQAEAKAKYGWSSLSSNNSYDWFMYALQRNLAAADTPAKRASAIKDAFDETDRLYGDRITTGAQIEARRLFSEKYETSPEKVTDDITALTNDLAKKALKRKVVSSEQAAPYTQQAEAIVIKNYAKQNNLTMDDATIMIEEAKRIENAGK